MARHDPFRTPIYTFELPEVEPTRDELVSRLLAERVGRPGIVRANVGGWHSTPDLALRPEPCFQSLMRAIVDRATLVVADLVSEAPRVRYGVQAWAMIMGSGDYTTLHDHGEAHLSVVYYADAAESEGSSGLLAFADPRRGGRNLPGLEVGSTFQIAPQTGMLVVFPGWLQHFVHPYRGTEPRVSISANVSLDAQR